MPFPAFNDRPAWATPGPPPAGRLPRSGGRSVLPPLPEDAAPRPPPARPPAEHPDTQPGQDGAPAASLCGPRMVGMYLVSPVVNALDNGWFASAVSIRSGGGAAPRVLRLTRLFRCAKQAGAYAHTEAANWIAAPPRRLAAP